MTRLLLSYVGDPVFSRTTGKAVLHIAQGIEKNVQILGMFCGVVSIDTIVNIISDIHVGDTGYGFLLAGDGLLISHPNKDLVMDKYVTTEILDEIGDITTIANTMTWGRTGTEMPLV